MRLLITIEDGIVECCVEGLPEGMTLELVQLDFDTDGYDHEDDPKILMVDGVNMFVDVGEVGEMTPEDSALARMARDTWAMTDVEDDSDLAEASAGFICEGCGRPEHECSADPCPAVIADRKG